MENFLIRENTTQLSNVNFILPEESGFTLEMGMTNALVECTNMDLKLYEAMTKTNALIEEYTNLDMPDAVATIQESAFEQIKTAFAKIINWIVSKIKALWSMLSAFFKKLFNKTETVLKKTPFVFKNEDESPEIRWFKDGIGGKFSEDMKEAIEWAKMPLAQGFADLISDSDNAVDIYSADPDLFMKKIGLTSINDKLKTAIDNNMTTMKASENVDFRSNVRALGVKSALTEQYNLIDKYVIIFSNMNTEDMVNKMLGSIQIIRGNSGVAPYMNDKAQKVRTILFKYASELIKTAELTKNIYLEVFKQYDSNCNKCVKYWEKINAEMDANQAKTESTLDYDMVDELCTAEFAQALRESHIDANGKPIIIFSKEGCIA